MRTLIRLFCTPQDAGVVKDARVWVTSNKQQLVSLQFGPLWLQFNIRQRFAFLAHELSRIIARGRGLRFKRCLSGLCQYSVKCSVVPYCIECTYWRSQNSNRIGRMLLDKSVDSVHEHTAYYSSQRKDGCDSKLQSSISEALCVQIQRISLAWAW